MLIVKTGTVRTALTDTDGDFEDWFARALGRPVQVCSVFEGDELPAPDASAGVVVTGSAAMVSDREAWIGRTAGWLRSAVDAPVLRLGRSPRAEALRSLDIEPAPFQLRFCASMNSCFDLPLNG